MLALMCKDVGRFQGVCAGDAIVMYPSYESEWGEDQGFGEAVLSMARCAKLPIHTHEAARIPMTRNVHVPARDASLFPTLVRVWSYITLAFIREVARATHGNGGFPRRDTNLTRRDGLINFAK